MSVVDPGRVVTITARQAKCLDAVRDLMTRCVGVTEFAVAHVAGVSDRCARDELVILRRLRLIAKRGQPAVPAKVVVDGDTSEPVPPPDTSGGDDVMLPVKMTPSAVRRAAMAQQAALRARFEATARCYEWLRRNKTTSQSEWCRGHDRLLAALQAYARSRGAAPCSCDGIAYYPNPSGDGFVRAQLPVRRRSIH